jgi:hypothetical protein
MEGYNSTSVFDKRTHSYLAIFVPLLCDMIWSEPWLHVGLFMVGCWAGNLYPKVELKMVQEINDIRSSKGLPPMVGSSAWIRYKAPEDENAQIEMKK